MLPPTPVFRSHDPAAQRDDNTTERDVLVSLKGVQLGGCVSPKLPSLHPPLSKNSEHANRDQPIIDASNS